MKRSVKSYISLFLSIEGGILIWDTFKKVVGGSPLMSIFTDFQLYAGIILLILGFLLYAPVSKE